MIEFCSYCHKRIKASGLKVGSFLVFCEDQCLEQFFSLYAEFYNELEKSIKENLKIQEDGLFNILSNLELCEEVLNSPLSAYEISLPIGITLYCQYGKTKHEDSEVFIFLIYTVVGDENIFIYVGASRELSFMQSMAYYVQAGKGLGEIAKEGEDKQPNMDLATSLGLGESELDLYLDHKKNSYLAHLLDFDYPEKEQDYSFEQYNDFNSFLLEVLENPDEIFCWDDEDDDKIYSHTKILEKDGTVLYYVVLCLSFDGKEMLPFLAIPTKSKKLAKSFQRGEKKLGILKN